MAQTTAFKRLLHFAHPGLLAAAGGLLGVSGFLVAKYYHDALGTGVFNDTIRTYIAAAASISFKLLAFGLLFISVLDFSEGRKTVGKWGFLATIALNAYFLYESHCMAEVWTAGTGGYWHILPLLAMLTLMVLFVEWRLAFSVGEAQESENHLAAAAQREQMISEQLAQATAQLSALQAEKLASENAQRIESERKAAEQQRLALLEAEQAERERQQREADAAKTISELQKKVLRLASEKGKPDQPETNSTRERVLQQALKLTRENGGQYPGMRAVEKSLGLSDGAGRHYFKNGSLQSKIEAYLQSEQEGLEITTAQHN